MSRKHYRAIAEVLAAHRPTQDQGGTAAAQTNLLLDSITIGLADVMSADNPAFSY